MTMQLARERAVTHESQLVLGSGVPLVVEFTSSRVRQRPLAARAGGIELPALGRLPVRAVDIDAYPDLRRRFRINLLPTFVVLMDQSEVARIVGPHSRRELAGALRRALDPAAVRVEQTPQARGLWNDFTARLWGFTATG
jgi:thioredoxin-like negative regulator of GroEL